MSEDRMSAVEKKAFQRCVDRTLLSMDELRGALMKIRDMENPLDADDDVVAKHNITSESMDMLMDVLGYTDDDEEEEA